MNTHLSNPVNKGHVALVGAGPGDPDLLTLKAYRLIMAADVVVYDNLVGHGILDMIPGHVEKIYVGKKASLHTMPQEEISDLLATLAGQGKRVVRLKGGDPFVFGRGGEELAVLQAAGMPVEIVPGITAALGAGASFGFPLTHRDHAQSCVFVTGHLKDFSIDLDWQGLSRPNQTVVIYMGITGLETISHELVAHGMSPDMPAALIYKATLPEERMVACTLSTLADSAKREQIKPPALVVIGTVVSLAIGK